MGAVLPEQWLRQIGYDWSREGSMTIKIASIWTGSLEGHELVFDIPLSVH